MQLVRRTKSSSLFLLLLHPLLPFRPAIAPHLPAQHPSVSHVHPCLLASLSLAARFASQAQSPLLEPAPLTSPQPSKKQKKKKKTDQAVDPLKHAAVSESLRALGVEKHIIQRIVDLQHPSLLEKMQLLLSREFSPLQVKTLVTDPYCRPFVVASYLRVLSVIYVLKSRGLTGMDAGKALTRNPTLFASSIENLEIRLKFFEDLELGEEGLKRILSWPSRHYSIFNFTVDNLQKRVTFLKGIGLGRENLRHVINRFPCLLMYNVETNLEPTVKFLEAKGMDKYAICKFVRTRPEALGLSVKNLNKKMELLEQMGFKFQARAGFRAFALLCISRNELLLARFDFLKSQGFSHDEVCKITQLQPSILISKQEVVKQKLDYLVNVLNRNIHEIVKFPAFLGYSLQKRMIPRFDILNQYKQKGLLEGDINLSVALTLTDEKFKQRFVTGFLEKLNGTQKED